MKKKMKKIAATAALAVALSVPIAHTAINAYNEKAVVKQEQAVAQAAVIKQGSKGNDVKEVQSRLKKWGYYNGSVDGVFGKQTRDAVIAFQKKNGLKADGVVGKATYQALGMNEHYNALAGAGATQTGGLNGFSSSDIYLLARTIYAEGRGEPYVGQVAIGAVILNRIKSVAVEETLVGESYRGVHNGDIAEA